MSPEDGDSVVTAPHPIPAREACYLLLASMCKLIILCCWIFSSWYYALMTLLFQSKHKPKKKKDVREQRCMNITLIFNVSPCHSCSCVQHLPFAPRPAASRASLATITSENMFSAKSMRLTTSKFSDLKHHAVLGQKFGEDMAWLACPSPLVSGTSVKRWKG